jgi:hypothetical protein
MKIRLLNISTLAVVLALCFKWLPWTEEHNAWEKIQKVHSMLFAIHQELLRLGEEYELMLGLGLLTWQTPTGQHLRRHLVVADAIL